MGKFFVLITQLCNRSELRIGFRVDSEGYRLLPAVLPPGKTRQVKLYRILRWLRQHEAPEFLKIRVTAENQFTGIELDPRILLNNTRIVFRCEGNVLCVDAIKEDCSRGDCFFRLKYFGFMRNTVWDSRSLTEITRSDTKLATKLRKLEGARDHLLVLFADTSSLKRPTNQETRERDGPIHKIITDELKSQPYVTAAVRPEKPIKIPTSPPSRIKSPPYVTAAVRPEKPTKIPTSPPSRIKSQPYVAAAVRPEKPTKIPTSPPSRIKSQPYVAAAAQPEKPTNIPMSPPSRMRYKDFSSTTDGSSSSWAGTRAAAAGGRAIREPKDSTFIHIFLFLFALSLLWFLPMLFGR